MIRFFMLLVLVCFSSFLFAAQWEWVKGYGSMGMDRVWDLALDTQDNLYITGEFIDTLTIQEQSFVGWGLNDIFVAKFSPAGEFLWAKVFGGLDGDIGLGIDVDASGNSYTTGYFASSANFGDQTVTAVDSWDIFILKLDTEGNMEWVKTAGGTSNDIGYGIATMPNGTSIVTGWFGGLTTFHDGSTLTSYGGSDIYVIAIDTQGNISWKHQAGSNGVEYGYKIDVDYSGNSYVTGSAGAGSDFDGLLAPGNGMFIASYSPQGQIRWVNSGRNAGVNSIAVDSQPSIIEQYGCVTGRITGNATFDSFSLSSVNGSDDAYNAVFDLLTGNWTSVVISGGIASDKGRACSYYQHPYYAGSYEDSFELFGFPVTSAGASDAYAFCDATETDSWLLSAGGINNDVITDIGVDIDGKVYVCGWYSGTVSFSASQEINSGADYDLDMFIAKIDPLATGNDDHSVTPNLKPISAYPNPFRSSVRIDLNGVCKATRIAIYNIKGQLIWAGIPMRNESIISWNGKTNSGEDCPSGVYLLQVEPGKKDTGTKLLVKIK